MNGMNRLTGKPISGVAYLQQRIDALMTTPFMTRVMRRNYAGIFNFVDKPVNKAFLVDLYAGVAVAINKWEPELKVKQISLQSVSKGKVELLLVGQYRELGMNGARAKPRDIKLSTSLSAGQ